jgi:DNA-binding SARP family transcriptional activator/predicted ATPase/predicted negative regulator of RcsB-dependent stress response
VAHLSLSLLGPFQVTLDGQPVRGFKSNKERALLAYLAVEADRPHRREVLAGLLWPEWPDRDALSNLRYALSNLRRVIGDRARASGRDAEPPFLLITRDTLQFNTASNHSLDVAAFTNLTGLSRTQGVRDLSGLEEAVALYRGGFLEGFSVGDSPAFEGWALLTREQIARQMSSALHRLAAAYEQRGEYEQAQSYAWRQVELEPWDEAAHQQLMRVLALSGQRGAALAQYETCRRLLAEELGVEPGAETTRLYQQIRDGELKPPAPLPARRPTVAAEPPPFLDEVEPIEVERLVFVARERELAQLDRFLELALAGQGRVVFVIGEAGSGKTALVQEFSRHAQDVHADLIVASGNCNAHTGIGDPYLPLREILGLLTGDVEARWAAGAMTGEHARRLWNTLPLTAQALVEAGPDLVDTFVPRAALLERAMAYAPGRADWLARLDQVVERKPTGAGMLVPQQTDLFEQYTRVLQALARQVSLVLVLDDLQWADAGSISLLFHLGRQLAGSRILILGAYRPEEVALGRPAPSILRQAQDSAESGQRERHPLEPVVNEFQRELGDIVVNVDQAERRAFVEALLDSEPNRLGVAFRRMLHRQTRGHPLFTIELLRGMQERGDLVQDSEGRWVEGPALDWETLPARVEAVIAERIGRLAEPLQGLLRVASVEGEVFTAEVVARVRAVEEGEAVGRLSGDLDRRHRLVRAQGIERLESRRVSRYRFRNYLFQKYLYGNLDRVERAYLHEEVGNVLEELYGGQASESADIAATAPVAVQLAWHFQEAGVATKAIDYLRQAGDRAMRLSAYQEAIAHFTRGLALLETLPDTAQRAQRELGLQTGLSVPLAHTKGLAAPEVDSVLARAWELCQQVGEAPQLFWVMVYLTVQRVVRGEHEAARETLVRIFGLAELAGEPLLVAVAHHVMGWLLVCLGEFVPALGHAEHVMDFCTPQRRNAVTALFGIDTAIQCLSWASGALWFLGYPEQALKRSQKALALAQELDHPYSLADAQSTGGAMVHLFRRDLQAAQALAEATSTLASEHEFPFFLAQATMQRGRVLAEQGWIEEGIAQLRQGLAAWETTGSRYRRPTFLAWLAEAYGQAGQARDGLSVLDEALAQVEKTDERCYEAELRRLKGDLLAQEGDEAEAEASLQHAIEVARRQSAKSWELRATTSLARLWQQQGKIDEARQMLAGIHGWFTEGFGTPDLQDASALLDELA